MPIFTWQDQFLFEPFNKIIHHLLLLFFIINRQPAMNRFVWLRRNQLEQFIKSTNRFSEILKVFTKKFSWKSIRSKRKSRIISNRIRWFNFRINFIWTKIKQIIYRFIVVKICSSIIHRNKSPRISSTTPMQTKINVKQINRIHRTIFFPRRFKSHKRIPFKQQQHEHSTANFSRQFQRPIKIKIQRIHRINSTINFNLDKHLNELCPIKSFPIQINWIVSPKKSYKLKMIDNCHQINNKHSLFFSSFICTKITCFSFLFFCYYWLQTNKIWQDKCESIESGLCWASIQTQIYEIIILYLSLSSLCPLYRRPFIWNVILYVECWICPMMFLTQLTLKVMKQVHILLCISNRLRTNEIIFLNKDSSNKIKRKMRIWMKIKENNK